MLFSRRDFVTTVAKGLVAGSATALLAACGQAPTAPPNTGAAPTAAPPNTGAAPTPAPPNAAPATPTAAAPAAAAKPAGAPTPTAVPLLAPVPQPANTTKLLLRV